METYREFELLVRDYLMRHPDIVHEWRRVADGQAGGRTELICAPDSEQEVVVTLRRDAITIGDSDGQVDFEDFGRGLSRQKSATKALAQLIILLTKKGYTPNIET